MLAEPLRRLDESDWVEGIVVVAPAGWEEPSILVAEQIGASKVRAGGGTRADSVRAGRLEVPEDAAVVLVHDAARPFVPAEVIERLVSALGEGYDGAVPGLPVADTIKRAPGGVVAETLDRSELVAVQTPQAFAADRLRAAFGATDLRDATDCASLVEADGGRVKVVPGDERLQKVTTRADLERVEGLLHG